MMWGWHDGGAWWWMALAGVAFWAVIAWAIVMLVRSNTTGSSHASHARDVLDERFARGEIDEDEYRRRRELIRH
jgi:putative membrane protein